MMIFGASTMDMGRSAEILGLQKLRSPEDNGMKKEYDDCMEKVKNHIAIKIKRPRIFSFRVFVKRYFVDLHQFYQLLPVIRISIKVLAKA